MHFAVKPGFLCRTSVIINDIALASMLSTSSHGMINAIALSSLLSTSIHVMINDIALASLSTSGHVMVDDIVLASLLSTSSHVMDSHPWLGLCLAGQVNVKSGISDWNVPTDVDSITALQYKTSAMIIYILYDSSWSQDVSSVDCIIRLFCSVTLRRVSTCSLHVIS